MTSTPPALLAIEPDDDHAEWVGKTADGRQFFLTTPFEPALSGHAGSEFVARYVFDAAGQLLQAEIEDFGPRNTMDNDARQARFAALLAGLGEVSIERIEVAPFTVARFGTEFGLIPCPPEDEEDEWVVEAQPGNYMAFYAPWDSGEYDT